MSSRFEAAEVYATRYVEPAIVNASNASNASDAASAVVADGDTYGGGSGSGRASGSSSGSGSGSGFFNSYVYDESDNRDDYPPVPPSPPSPPVLTLQFRDKCVSYTGSERGGSPTCQCYANKGSFYTEPPTVTFSGGAQMATALSRGGELTLLHLLSSGVDDEDHATITSHAYLTAT